MTRGIEFKIDESGAVVAKWTLKGGDEVQSHAEADTEKIVLNSRADVREWVGDKLATFLKDRTTLPEATPSLFAQETEKVETKKKAAKAKLDAKPKRRKEPK